MLTSRAIPRSVVIPVMIVLALLVVVLVPISVPTSISAVGRVAPSKEWYLLHDRAGRIMAVLNDRIANATNSLLVHQFERQDAVRFDLFPGVDLHGILEKGDTIGIVSSAESEIELARLEGDLGTAEATTRVYETGEKSAVLLEAEKNLAYATRQFEGHRRTVERMKALLDRGVISAQEFEFVENASDLYRAEIDVARARLRTVETGAKPAQQDVGRSGRSSLLSQVRAVRRKIDRGILTAPFSGTVLHSALSDTLFRLGDTRTLAVVFGIPWPQRSQLHDGQKVVMTVPTVDDDITAVVRSIGNVVHIVSGRQVVLVTASIHAGSVRLLPGVVATCTITCPPVPLRTFLLSHLRNLFRN